MAKYEKEIKQVFRDACFQDWMSEQEYSMILDTVMRTGSLSYEKMSDEIDVGIDNGCSLEVQMSLLAKVFKGLK